MRLSLILAVSRNSVIGRDGAIPWKISTDMRRFRQLTLGKPIIMGRKQYDSVGKPLDGRDNIVLTRNASFAPPGVHVVANLDDAIHIAEDLALAHGGNEIMVIGGAQIYEQALPRANRIYLSRVDADIEGDARFDIPALSNQHNSDSTSDTGSWHIVETLVCPAGPKDEHPHTFIIYDRINSLPEVQTGRESLHQDPA